MIKEAACAKINLFLEVLGRQADGYHHLQSLMIFADVGEWVSAEKSGSMSLSLSGPQAQFLNAQDPSNLVLRAAYAFQAAAQAEGGVRLHLHKVMPVASGIGGGSADAAAALRALNALYETPCDEQTLLTIADTLGADVPACLMSKAVTLNGASAQLHPAQLSFQPQILLVNPGVGVETARVFHALNAPPVGTVCHSMPTRWTLDDVRRRRNDLAAPATTICPEITLVLEALQACEGVQMARMSGSGATCFALFETHEEAVSAAQKLREGYSDWWVAAGQFSV